MPSDLQKDHQPTAAGLAGAVRALGWVEGLEQYLRPFDEAATYWIRWSLSSRHVSWKGLLPAGSGGSIVLVDRGWGTSVVTLARQYARVHAIFTDQDLADIVRARAEWLGLTNITSYTTDGLHAAPLPPASCDAAALCQVSCDDITPDLARALSEWLRPDALLFASLLRPRLTLGGILALVRSHRALRSVSNSRTYFRYLGAPVSAAEIVPLRIRTARPRQIAASLAAPLLSPALAIVGRTGIPGASQFEQVLADLAARRGVPRTMLQVERYVFSNPGGLTLQVRDRTRSVSSFVKMPFHPLATERMLVNHRMLRLLNERQLVSPTAIPQAEEAGRAGECPYFVEGAVHGRAVSRRELREERTGASLQTQAFEWITALHTKTAVAAPMDAPRMERLVIAPLESALRFLQTADNASTLRQLRDFLIRFFDGRTLPLVLSHGDFTLDNMFFDASPHPRICAVFDWDLGDIAGLPCLDLLYNILTIERTRSGSSTVASSASIFRRTLLQGAYRPLERQAIERYRASLGIDAEAIAPLTLMMWVHHLAIRMRTPEPAGFSARDWDEVLAALPQLTASRVV
ncbi:MAG TPA: phosphotransferase [Vicinamibacterales bacterium]